MSNSSEDLQKWFKTSSITFKVAVHLPLNNILILPKLPRQPPNLPNRQHNRRLRSLIRRFRPSMLRHIRIHITRTTRIDQPLPTPSLLLPRNRLRHRGHARFTDSVCSRWPTLLPLFPGLDRGFESFHQCGDLFDGVGVEEAGADGVGVPIQLSRRG